jgi:hypothetical protein
MHGDKEVWWAQEQRETRSQRRPESSKETRRCPSFQCEKANDQARNEAQAFDREEVACTEISRKAIDCKAIDREEVARQEAGGKEVGGQEIGSQTSNCPESDAW